MTEETKQGGPKCASCGVPVAPEETELVSNTWSLLFPPKRVPRCGRCLQRRKRFVFGFCLVFLVVVVLSQIVVFMR